MLDLRCAEDTKKLSHVPVRILMGGYYLWHPYKMCLRLPNATFCSLCGIICVIYNSSNVHLFLPQLTIFRSALAAALKVTCTEIANFATANWFGSGYMMLEAWWEGAEYYLMSAMCAWVNWIHSMCLFASDKIHLVASETSLWMALYLIAAVVYTF